MKAVLLFLAGIVSGAASWALCGAITGTFEPFDNTTGFFICQTTLALPALIVGLRSGILRALLCLLGAWVGMNAYAYLFGSSETRAWIVLLMFSSLTLLVFPSIAGIIGGTARALRRRSEQKSILAHNASATASSSRAAPVDRV